jgi:hypothetical protein
VNFPKRIKYRGTELATKAEGRKWFDVKPSNTAKNVMSLPAGSRTDAP